MKNWIIVDGYNFLGRRHNGLTDHGMSIEQSRKGFIRQLDPLVGELSRRITVVFDGVAEGGTGEDPSAVDVLFSPGHISADTLIHQMLLAAESTADILVVSSDLIVRNAAEINGAQSMSVTIFSDWMIESMAGLRARAGRRARPHFVPRLGDFFPKK